MDINALITKKETLVENTVDDAVHIALCFDKNYGLPAGVLVSSILQNNPDKNISVHLFVLSINESDIERFKLFTQKNISIHLYYVDPNFEINPSTMVLSYITIAACLRLFVANYLSNITERLIYLDCDMLCDGSLDQIINHDLSNFVAAVVLDLDYSQKIRCDACNVELGTYFNSGMLYINTRLWTELNLTEKLLCKINDGNVYEYADQDVLNILLAGKVKYLSTSCNNMLRVHDDQGKLIKNNDSNDTVIFHYIGADKPWYQIYADDLYQSYISLSPWKDASIEIAPFRIPRHLRRYSNYLSKNGRYASALKYRILYFLNKLHLINTLKS